MSKYPKEGTLYNEDYSLKLDYEYHKKDRIFVIGKAKTIHQIVFFLFP